MPAPVHEGAIVRHSKRPRRGRARDNRAAAEALFERALLGESSFADSNNRGVNPRLHRKTLQLCRQVQRAMSLALAGECADDVLRDAYVDSVAPMGGPGQLVGRIVAPTGAAPAEVMTRLAAQVPRLRAIVAREICRKRVPGLSFVVVPEGGAHGQ